MTVLLCHPAGLEFNRHALAIAVLLISAVVVARGDERLDAPPKINPQMSDELYEQAEGWRTGQAGDESWRAPQAEPRARMHFGFDSAFEEKQMRNSLSHESRRSNLRDTTPNTQFRLEFFPKKSP